MPEIICKDCGKVCKNLRGWKTHMTGAHGGFSKAEMQDVAGVPSGEFNTKQRMADFATQFGGPKDDEEVEIAGDGSFKPKSKVTEMPPPDNTRRIKATPKKLKKILGGIPAKILEEMKITLDGEDHDALDEAAEFLADCFGFEFSVPESKVTVESRWWALLWVGGITALIYFKHRSGVVFQMMKEMGDDKDKPSVE